ncbi:MSC_0882 family membrane protein [Mycoplasma sp. 1018B]|uniref:MSC_0882 family membrane protein n=1 Tax=Mycoplasma sp. 1018B TaxID=2967302 RepID=UPI00211B87A1|nr:hypothetical protein [Mycoplasma sp. 1018B]UUM19017.1 hypothetical protein NPA14_01605 [Mycoplasma sp. 1018B]
MQENKYNPIENTENIEIIKNEKNFKIFDNQKKVYTDPDKILSSSTYKVVKIEQRLKLFLTLFSLLFFIISSILFILIYLEVGWIFNQKYDGYLVLLGFIMFFSLVFCLKNFIEKIKWDKTIKNMKNSTRNGDYSYDHIFYITYKKIILKNVNLLWISIFIITYLGIFTLILYGIYTSGVWEIGKDSEVFNLKIDWKLILDNAFGNTINLCIINCAILIAVVVFYTIISLIDKKRLSDIEVNFSEKATELINATSKEKNDRNKLWVKIYIVCVLLTILLPILVVLILFWKKVIRRKK